MPREAMTAELIERAKTIATQRRDDAEKARVAYDSGDWHAGWWENLPEHELEYVSGYSVNDANGTHISTVIEEHQDHIANHDPAAMVPLWTWALDFIERHKPETEPEFYYAECKTCDPDDECEGHEVQICSYCWAPSDDGYAGQVLYPCSELKSLAHVIVGDQP